MRDAADQRGERAEDEVRSERRASTAGRHEQRVRRGPILHERQLEEYYCTLCYALFETPEPTFQDWQRVSARLAELLGRGGMHFNLEMAIAHYLDMQPSATSPEMWRVELMQ